MNRPAAVGSPQGALARAIERFKQAAVAAQRTEIDFRDGIGAEMARLERVRQFAFRRLDLVQRMLTAATGSDDVEQAIERQSQALIEEIGWHGDTERRRMLLDAWRPVAHAVWLGLSEPSTDVDEAEGTESIASAMAAFEARYEAVVGAPFLALFDHEMVETPVVEF